MGEFGVGQAVRRIEDARLLTGQGRYTDDVNLEGQAYAAVVRSPFAHATLAHLDVEAARQAPGVLAVITGRDLEAAGIGTLPCLALMPGRNGSKTITPPRPVLASERVRHVGDPIAFVVAETLDQARDAAELVELDFDAQPADAEPRPTSSLSEDLELAPPAPVSAAMRWNAFSAECRLPLS